MQPTALSFEQYRTDIAQMCARLDYPEDTAVCVIFVGEATWLLRNANGACVTLSAVDREATREAWPKNDPDSQRYGPSVDKPIAIIVPLFR
jgi:hypothetical protein